MRNKLNVIRYLEFAIVVMAIAFMAGSGIDRAYAEDQPGYGQFQTTVAQFSPITHTTAMTELLPDPPTSCQWVVEWVKWEVTAKDDAATAIIQDGYTTAVTVEYIPLDTESGPFWEPLGGVKCTEDENVVLNFNSSDTGILAITIAAHSEYVG